MSDYDDKDVILKTLKKRNIRVIEDGPDIRLVGYLDKKTVKIGYMTTNYTHRYGIRTFCTYKEGRSYPWFQSNSDEHKIKKEDLSKIMAGKLEEYPPLDVDSLNIMW